MGNMIADFVRNSDRKRYPETVQKGIALHREIDTFTDAHSEISKAKKVFSPLVRLYSGAFVDVAFDYFLANSWSENALMEHSLNVYSTLWKYEDILPLNFKRMLERMAKDNWLYHYRFDDGIRFSMQNVLNKAKYLGKDVPVFSAFLAHKKELGECFEVFYPQLYEHAKEFI